MRKSTTPKNGQVASPLVMQAFSNWLRLGLFQVIVANPVEGEDYWWMPFPEGWFFSMCFVFSEVWKQVWKLHKFAELDNKIVHESCGEYQVKLYAEF